jgi:FkbM family methyltransferase
MSLLKRVARRVLPEPLYRVYRRWRVARLVTRYQARVVDHTYGGRRLRIAIEDPLAEGWYDRDWEMPKELAIVQCGALRPGALMFDLGAHQAVVALIASDLVGTSGRVVAVEAEAHNVRVARRNVELNDAANVEIVHAAVSDNSDRALFAEGLNGRMMPGTKWGKISVDAVTIDELASRYGHPDVVLLDIEGAEAQAVRAATETIRLGTTFVIELHVGCGLEDLGGTADQTVEAFHGYHCLTSPTDSPLGWTPVRGSINARSFLFVTPEGMGEATAPS